MTPEPVEVVEVPGFEGRFSAAIVLDGRATSFGCTHLHHSRAAAQKCRGRVATEWNRYRSSAVLSTEPYTIVELTGGTSDGRRVWTRRYTFNDETLARALAREETP